MLQQVKFSHFKFYNSNKAENLYSTYVQNLLGNLTVKDLKLVNNF